MFILNNIYNRNYKVIYKNFDNVVFDISDAQLKNAKNNDWFKVTVGDIVCVVTSTRKISTFFIIESRLKTEIVDIYNGAQHIITGKVIAKLPEPIDMTSLLNKHNVNHHYLPYNKFSNGFNVADLGDKLDSLIVNIKNGTGNLGKLA